MIDLTIVDQLFEIGRETGAPAGFHIFDRRILLPLSQLSEAIEAEVGLAMTLDDLRARARDGWFPLLPQNDSSEEPGAPLYVPSRVGLFSELEGAGWTREEIRECAEVEEALIACVLTVEEFTYEDDDLQLLIKHTRSMIDSHEHSSTRGGGGAADQSGDLARQRQHLEFFERLVRNGLPPALEVKVAKHAFRVRAWNEAVRLQMVEQDRAQLRQGYSPCVQFRRWSCRGFGDHSFEGVMWDSTLRAAIAHDESPGGPLVRVPGFTLRGDRVSPCRTLRPAEYEQLWSQHDLDGYLMAWAKVRGDRCCANCLEPLPSGASEQRRFCGDRCRNAAKQRRFRQRNPEAAERARRRYYNSIEDDE